MITRKNIEVFIPYCDAPFYVNYNFYHGCRGVHTLRNGDPGYPDEEPDVDLTCVAAREDGEDLMEALSESAIDNIVTAVIEYESDAGGPGYDDFEEDYTVDDATLRDWLENDAQEEV